MIRASDSIKTHLKRLLPPRLLNLLRRFYRAYRTRIQYGGTSVSCPVCGRSFSQMMSYGVMQSAAVCPNCGTHPRHRLYYLYFQQQGLFMSPASILHFAPNPGIARHFQRAESRRYVRTDIDPTDVDICADITCLPWADKSFDVVLCSHVLEHIPEDRAAMREIFRVLKAGGWALLQTPLPNPDPDTTFEDPSINTPEARLRAFGQDDHVRLYGAHDFIRRLEAAGFDVQVLPTDTLLSESEILRYVITDRALYIGRKKP